MVGGRHRSKLDVLAGIGLKVELEEKLGSGFDCVIDCTGSAQGFARAPELVRPCGKLVLKSAAAGSAPLNLAPAVINEISVIGSSCGRFAPAIEALQSGRVVPRSLISERFSLEDSVEAFAAAGHLATFKLLLQIS
jgi:threonine dehydrogenase-like Zn-dependent dehydrogenase